MPAKTKGATMKRQKKEKGPCIICGAYDGDHDEGCCVLLVPDMLKAIEYVLMLDGKEFDLPHYVSDVLITARNKALNQ